VINAYVLATGLQFCAIVHSFDVTGDATAGVPAVATTWNVHFTVSDSEKPSVVLIAVIRPGAVAVLLTPDKETGAFVPVLTHVTSAAL